MPLFARYVVVMYFAILNSINLFTSVFKIFLNHAYGIKDYTTLLISLLVSAILTNLITEIWITEDMHNCEKLTIIGRHAFRTSVMTCI